VRALSFRHSWAVRASAACAQIEGPLVSLRRHVDEATRVSRGRRRPGGRYRPLLVEVNRTEWLRKIGRDVGPCAFLAEGVPFRQKLFESRDHDRSRNTSWAASSRVDGSFVPGRNAPERIADRSRR
jgi:hypothetical protein